jgi:peptidoglycan hydrolase CwlO-like protein
MSPRPRLHLNMQAGAWCVGSFVAAVPSLHLSKSLRLGAVAALAVTAVALAPADRSSATSLPGQIQSSKRAEGSLSAGISADQHAIAGYHGRIADLQARLNELQSSLDSERSTLSTTQGRLRGAHADLTRLRIQLAHDRAALARELVGEYEAGHPELVEVVLEASNLSDLLEEGEAMRRVQAENVRIANTVRTARTKVDAQVTRLTGLEASQEREAAAVLVQRDQVAQVKLALVDRELAVEQARDAKSAKLGALRSRRAALEKRYAAAQAKAAAAQTRSYLISSPGASGASGGDGFFPAAGTNYSVGNEPELAVRLNRMAQALHLHLIGISGYRTPEHSMEVGGFADDPHTRGEASDTPGVEGVPESVLNQYGLTRPFGGAAEADHIQLG